MQRQIPPIILLLRLPLRIGIRRPRNSGLPSLGQFVKGDVFRIFGRGAADDAVGGRFGAFPDSAGGGGDGGGVVLVVGGGVHRCVFFC